MPAVPGALVEYGLSIPPLAVVFDFNPQTITRNRTITVKTGGSPATRGGYDFTTPSESVRAAQGVEVQPESFSIDILLDASDAIGDGDPVARQFGVLPQVDTLRVMLEPKPQGPPGAQALASLGLGGDKAFQRHESVSVVLFVWGVQVLPVFLTGVTQKETQHLPNLTPYRAEMTINMQVIESENPFFIADRVRRTAMSALNAGQLAANVLGGLG